MARPRALGRARPRARAARGGRSRAGGLAHRARRHLRRRRQRGGPPACRPVRRSRRTGIDRFVTPNCASAHGSKARVRTKRRSLTKHWDLLTWSEADSPMPSPSSRRQAGSRRSGRRCISCARFALEAVGSPDRAAAAFRQAWTLAPDDPITAYLALARSATRRRGSRPAARDALVRTVQGVIRGGAIPAPFAVPGSGRVHGRLRRRSPISARALRRWLRARDGWPARRSRRASAGGRRE